MSRTLVRPALRALRAEDRAPIERMTRAVGVFHEFEVPVALEVLDASLRPGQTDYETLGAEVDGRLAGWICWGETPCAEGTWDLYWLAVDPDAHGAGIGTALVEEMERRLAGRARLIVVETGGRPAYDGTRAFYLARGYRVAATIPDFYAPGDAQVVFVKMLNPSRA
ncbi:MAG: GNAT family N-acetyltransferase [Gemmatimonadales bacterium]